MYIALDNTDVIKIEDFRQSVNFNQGVVEERATFVMNDKLYTRETIEMLKKYFKTGDGRVFTFALRDEENGDNVRVKVKRPTRFWLEVPYPIICALAYLIFGFYDICGGWTLSWIIFVTIPVYYSLVEAIYKRSFAHFAYPVFCAFVYLICGLYLHNWHPSWLIFATIPVYYPIADALDRMVRK
jgi:hypothetical protein